MSYAVSGVSVHLSGATLLDDVSLDVSPGELVVVAGPNGAGKSTLLATLAGDRTPSSGAVTLDGRAVADWPKAELARRRAVMGPESNVAFAYTAAEVVLLGRLPLHGGDPDDADRRVVSDLLEAVDCTHLADRVFATLSTGERQRASLARAVAQVVDAGTRHGDADVRADAAERYLLLDEPTSSLDPAHQHTAVHLLRRMADAGRGVLAVLHDLNLAAAYADRIVLLHAGRVAATGSPAEVLRPDLLESVFEIPMLVIPHPQLSHPLVVAQPAVAVTTHGE